MPIALDLFCGAGGASVGLHRAGFDVVGVDIATQPNYPFTFVQADALRPPIDLRKFDLIWASPPCQAYVPLAKKDGRHPKLIEPTRSMLQRSGRPYVIENVELAPLINPIRLCGSMFGLGVRRHRRFEYSEYLLAPQCRHALQGDDIRAYYGKPGRLVWSRGAAQVQKAGRKPLLRGCTDDAPADMGIDWMTWDELREAIPPAYSEFIGRDALRQMESVHGR